MSAHRLEAGVPVLPTPDLARSLAFYGERLGFHAAFQLGPYAGLVRDRVELHLSQEDAPPVTCRFQVAGVDGLHDELAPRGVIHPAEPLESKPWGMRQFSVLDDAGNRITFAERVARAEGRGAPRRFAITFTHVEGATEGLGKEDVRGMIESHAQWTREVDAQPRSSLVYFDASSAARTVRRHADGRLEVLDGPFTQCPEASGGFYIVEADSPEHAVEIAKRHRWLPGSNEVRELVAPPGLRTWIRS